MSKYIFITFLLFTYCNSFASGFIPIKESDIKSISIYPLNNKNKTIQLSKQEIQLFVTEWNNQKTIGLCKYIARIWLVVEHLDGTKRKFRLNSQNIKENNDYCYRISSTYSKLLYAKIK